MGHRAWCKGQGPMGMLASRRMAEKQSREVGEHGAKGKEHGASSLEQETKGKGHVRGNSAIG
jgi:hypothetical protein